MALDASHACNVYTIEQSSQACKASNTKDLGILDQGGWTRRALQRLATLESRLVEIRSTSYWCHDQGIEVKMDGLRLEQGELWPAICSNGSGEACYNMHEPFRQQKHCVSAKDRCADVTWACIGFSWGTSANRALVSSAHPSSLREEFEHDFALCISSYCKKSKALCLQKRKQADNQGRKTYASVEVSVAMSLSRTILCGGARGFQWHEWQQVMRPELQTLRLNASGQGFSRLTRVCRMEMPLVP